MSRGWVLLLAVLVVLAGCGAPRTAHVELDPGVENVTRADDGFGVTFSVDKETTYGGTVTSATLYAYGIEGRELCSVTVDGIEADAPNAATTTCPGYPAVVVPTTGRQCGSYTRVSPDQRVTVGAASVVLTNASNDAYTTETFSTACYRRDELPPSREAFVAAQCRAWLSNATNVPYERPWAGWERLPPNRTDERFDLRLTSLSLKETVPTPGPDDHVYDGVSDRHPVLNDAIERRHREGPTADVSDLDRSAFLTAYDGLTRRSVTNLTDLPTDAASDRYAVDSYGPEVDCRTLSYTGSYGHEVSFYADGRDGRYRVTLEYTADVSGPVVEDRRRILRRRNATATPTGSR